MSLIHRETNKFKSSASQWANLQTAAGVRTCTEKRGQRIAHQQVRCSDVHLNVSLAVSSTLSQLWLPLTLLNIPNVDDLVLGKVVASCVGQCNVPLLQGRDPCFLMSHVLHVLAEPLSCRVVVKMRNRPESVHFAQELHLLLLTTWMHWSCITITGSAGGALSGPMTACADRRRPERRRRPR